MAGKINHKQEQVIVALLNYPTIKQAADASGVGETTIYRWLRDEDFKQSYKEVRHKALGNTIARLQQVSQQAVNTLQEVMMDDTATPNSRVSAAKAVLEMAFKAYELEDLAQRVEELEKHLEEGGKAG
ncbi:helix-turn-helix transcriptional regulator [Ammoniphilus resinae]|uniref:DNA-binding MurR/RpiR family transcriptional regulator n=1 Tax=Ammoniphilus resinae TaxID=861532 RepID=A0ABS4GX97_9BACL|nr:hypothetical protein [Ammoniphilus resinae]MBP1934892.1 DNA-binding MurR/RpiR family transcriptional regulator [Ammoniphilus resinae]